MKHITILVAFFLSGFSCNADTVWVFFTDRGPVDVGHEVAAKIASPSEPKNFSRRASIYGRDRIFDERDLPVNPEYISTVAGITGDVRTVTRYFNGVSVETGVAEIEQISRLSFVREIRPVAVFRKSLVTDVRYPRKPSAEQKVEGYSYGDSYEQLAMLDIPAIHDAGYTGSGITIAVLDSGFDGIGHVAFDSLTVAGARDFVDGDDDPTGDDHGTEVLSILSALDDGRMIGAAPYSTYLLARTEKVDKEEDERIEEDYWVAGIEWADSLGADIVNSSLGYTTFDDGSGYTYEDLDGDTAITTIAADTAAEKGMIVVTSAGNEGDDEWYYVSTPADGDSVLAVGSVDLDRNVSAFSSRGPTYDGRIKPDFVALGENVLMVDAGTKNAYKFSRGTSYAAPALSGAVALLLQVNPGWDYGSLRDALTANAAHAEADSLAGYGIPDAYAASGLEPQEPPVSAFRVYDPYPQPITFSATSRRIYFPMDIPETGKTLTIRIFNFAGENIQKLEAPVTAAGNLFDPGEAPSWDGTNFLGEDVAPGVYYYSIQLFGYGSRTGKIMVMR